MADGLWNTDLNRQEMGESNEENNGMVWCVLGCMRAMVIWGLDDIPMDAREFQEMRLTFFR